MHANTKRRNGALHHLLYHTQRQLNKKKTKNDNFWKKTWSYKLSYVLIEVHSRLACQALDSESAKTEQNLLKADNLWADKSCAETNINLNKFFKQI